MRILVTGGAGFVGGTLARYFARHGSAHSIVVIDNLRRRGSELNLDGLRSEGVMFVHGDIRNPSDLEDLDGNFDVLIEAPPNPVFMLVPQVPRVMSWTRIFWVL
jgi:CDP-paratose 2-epimerase